MEETFGRVIVLSIGRKQPHAYDLKTSSMKILVPLEVRKHTEEEVRDHEKMDKNGGFFLI